jgi:hypothetical protein
LKGEIIMAKKYTGSQALLTFMQIIQTELGKKVSVADVLTSLKNYSSTNDANKAIAASVVNEINTTLDSFVKDGKVTADYIGTVTVDELVKWRNVISSLDSITDSNKTSVIPNGAVALELNTKITALDTTLNGLTGSEGKVASAEDSDKLGGNAPSYYATAQSVTDLKNTASNTYVTKTSVLDSNGIILSSVLPSYVDDVIEGYAVTSETDSTVTFYEDSAHKTTITGERGKIYVDITEGSNRSYRWSGSTYIEITSADMVELTSDELQTIWDEVLAG